MQLVVLVYWAPRRWPRRVAILLVPCPELVVRRAHAPDGWLEGRDGDGVGEEFADARRGDWRVQAVRRGCTLAAPFAAALARSLTDWNGNAKLP